MYMYKQTISHKRLLTSNTIVRIYLSSRSLTLVTDQHASTFAVVACIAFGKILLLIFKKPNIYSPMTFMNFYKFSSEYFTNFLVNISQIFRIFKLKVKFSGLVSTR